MRKAFKINDTEIVYDSRYHIFGEKKLIENFPENDDKLDCVINDDRKIVEIRIHISNRCLLACSYCYLNGMDWKGRDLTFGDLDKVCDYIENNPFIQDGCTISFLGAEPIDEFEKVKYLVEKLKKGKKEYGFAISTNGYSLTKTIIEYLKYNKFNVVISLDGDKDVQNYFRRTKGNEETYDTIINNIQEMRKLNLSFDIQSVITRETFDIIKNTTHHEQLCPRSIKYYYEVSDAEWSKKQIELIIVEVEKLWEYFRKSILTEKPVHLFHNISILRRIHSGEKRVYHCGSGKSTLYIGNDLKVYPCNMIAYNGESLFDINKNDSADSIDNLKYYELNVDKCLKCSECWAKYFCGGKCEANKADICEIIRYDIMQGLYTYMYLYNTVPNKLENLLNIKRKVNTQGYIRKIADDLKIVI